MKLLIFVVVCLGLFAFLTTQVNATQVTVDLDKVSSEDAAKILEAKKQSEALFPKASTPDNLEKYADIGIKIAKAIGAAAKELSVEVNSFIKTPAGMITVGLIAWEVAGKDLWGIIGGIIGWSIITTILIWSFTRFHVSKKVVSKNKETGAKTVTYVERHEFNSRDAKTASAAVHVILFVVNCLVGIVIIF